VGFFDILGFRDLVQRKDASETGALLVELASAAKQLEIGALTFSDSVLLFTEGTRPEDLVKIVRAAVRLIGNFAGAHVALRGGIAVGEFFSNGEVFVGKAMVRAYELAEAQDWMGAILDPSISLPLAVFREFQTTGLLVEYAAPIKGGPVGPLMCVGWPRNYPSVVSPLATVETSSWDVLRKDTHTQQFLTWYKETAAWRHLPPI
jgi:hypothetical protein